MSMNPNTPLVLWTTCIAMLVCLLVAVTAPDDVVSTYPLLKAYTDAWRAVIPGIDRLARISSFPEVTRLVVSTMWTAVLILTVVYLRKLRPAGEPWARYRGKRSHLTLSIVLMAISVACVAILYDIAPGDLQGGLLNERVLRGVSTSRLGLGLITGFFAAGLALLTFGVLRWLRDFRTIYFADKGGDRP